MKKGESSISKMIITGPQMIMPTINHILCHKTELVDALIMQFLSATAVHFVIINALFMAASQIAANIFSVW